MSGEIYSPGDGGQTPQRPHENPGDLAVTDETCRTCRFWFPHPGFEGTRGDCTFRPPVAPPDQTFCGTAETGRYRLGRWPETRPKERCGAHEPQPGRDG